MSAESGPAAGRYHPRMLERLRRGDFSATIALGAVAIGFGAIGPALAEIQHTFGGGAGLSAFLVGGFAAGRLFAGVPAGLLINRIGPDQVSLLGAVLFLAGSLVGGLAPEFWLLAAGRLLQGVGCAVAPAGGLARLMSNTSTARAGGAMALYQTILVLGTALGAFLAGPLVSWTGWRAAFFLCAVGGIVAVVMAAPSSRTSKWRPEAKSSEGPRLGLAAGLLVVLIMLPNAVASFDRFAVNQLALPLYASVPAGLDAFGTGLLLGTLTVISLLVLGPAGWVVNRWDVRWVIVGSALVTAVGLAAVPLAPGIVELYAATIFYGVGLSALGVSGALYVFKLPGYSTGTLVAMYRLSTDFIQVIGPLLVGLAIEGLGFTSAFLWMAVFGLTALLGLLVPIRSSRG